jgi:GH15 family glucan-1,4-alpha-glucosidase
VRYFGTGEEEADFSGQQSPNVETDGWGMFMWSARQYVQSSGDTGWLSAPTKKGDTAYAAIKAEVADALEANLEPNGIAKADSSIWEVHDQNKRHFAFTTMAAARGFCDMAVLAKKNGDAANVQKYQDLAKKVTTGLFNAFADPQGAIGGSVEGLSPGINKYYDGAVAELFNWSILTEYTGPTAKATLDMFGNLKVDSGGFKRNNDGLSSYDNNEWILVDMRISGALRRAGRTAEADSYVAQLVQKASVNFYLLPELFNDVQADGQIGKYTGSIPMVGYGGGAFIMTMLDRAGKYEAGDCVGDSPGGSSSSGGGPGGTGGTGGPGGTGGGGGGPGGNGAPDASQVPYSAACLCNLHSFGAATPWGLALVPFALFLRRLRRK